MPTGTRWRTLAGDAGRILTLTLSQDGQLLGSVHRTSDRSCIQIWDMETGSLCHRLIGHNKAVRCLAISPGNTTLVSGGQKIKVWNIRTGKLQYTLSGHKQAVYALAVSPTGQILASSSDDKTVRLWHLPSGMLLHTLT